MSLLFRLLRCAEAIVYTILYATGAYILWRAQIPSHPLLHAASCAILTYAALTGLPALVRAWQGRPKVLRVLPDEFSAAVIVTATSFGIACTLLAGALAGGFAELPPPDAGLVTYTLAVMWVMSALAVLRNARAIHSAANAGVTGDTNATKAAHDIA